MQYEKDAFEENDLAKGRNRSLLSTMSLWHHHLMFRKGNWKLGLLRSIPALPQTHLVDLEKSLYPSQIQFPCTIFAPTRIGCLVPYTTARAATLQWGFTPEAGRQCFHCYPHLGFLLKATSFVIHWNLHSSPSHGYYSSDVLNWYIPCLPWPSHLFDQCNWF